MATFTDEDKRPILISKGGPRNTTVDAYGHRQLMKQVVYHIKQGFKRKDGKDAYRSMTRHIPI